MKNLCGKHILIIDDEIKIANIIKAYLDKFKAIAFLAHTGAEGLKYFNENNINLILLDLMLPDIPGEEICKCIREKSNVPIIMITAKVEEADELEGLSTGADDYMVKPFSYKILLARMDRLLKEPLSKQRELFTDGILKVDFENKLVSKHEVPVALSKIEMNILMKLIRFPEKTFTRDELIQLVLGYDFNGLDRTIDAHIKNIRKKIEDNPKKPRYIITIHGIGYRFGVSPR